MGEEKSERKHLGEFFAVTRNSLYRVSREKAEHNIPIVEQIAAHFKSDLLKDGRLHGGYYVGITKDGLVLYYEDYLPGQKPSHIQRPEMVNVAQWGDHTSYVVALFLNKDEALNCFNSSDDLKQCDPRWRVQTEETLEVIGDNHPVFILSILDAIRY